MAYRTANYRISDQVQYSVMAYRTASYRISDQVKYSVMAYRTSNQAWSKGLDAGT